MENGHPQSDPLIGKVVSERYRVLERIGHGGFGAVYKVQHVKLDKILALKVLFEHSLQSPRMIKRFEREARATCRIGHENIVEITDFSRDRQAGYYFVMEYLEGETLADRLKKLGPLPAARLANVGAQLADALAATHAKGIVHRDLKPDNIFLIRRKSDEDFVKILDFGIAAMGDLEAQFPRLTRHGQMLGTPAYMSPEQADGLPPDARSDIYSLGIILYELATGNVPFRNVASMAVLEMHRNQQPVPPRQARPELNIPVELEQVILRALRKNVSQRYQSMREVYNDLIELTQLATQAPLTPRVDGPTGPARADIETEEPEWLDEDLVLLDDEDEPGPTLQMDLPGPTQPMSRPAPAPRVEPTVAMSRPGRTRSAPAGSGHTTPLVDAHVTVVNPAVNPSAGPGPAPVRPAATRDTLENPAVGSRPGRHSPTLAPASAPATAGSARAERARRPPSRSAPRPGVSPASTQPVRNDTGAATDRVIAPPVVVHSKGPWWSRPPALIAAGFVATLALYGLFNAIHSTGGPAPDAATTPQASDTPGQAVDAPKPAPAQGGAVTAPAATAPIPTAPAAPSPAPSPTPGSLVERRLAEAGRAIPRRAPAEPPALVVEPHLAEAAMATPRRGLGDLETAYITFESTPPGAVVREGDTELGTTPFEYAAPLSKSPLRVTFSLEGHRSTRQRVTPNATQTIYARLTRPKRGGGSGGGRPSRGNNGYDLF